MKTSKIDIVKVIKRVSRDTITIPKNKIEKSKKLYTRKQKHKKKLL